MRTRLSSGFNGIPENVAAVVFSHLGDDPRDRVALAQVSKVWRDAEKSETSLPGGSLSALSELISEELYFMGEFMEEEDDAICVYWLRKALDHGDVDAMNDLAYRYSGGYGVKQDHKKAVELWERASGCGHTVSTMALASSYRYGDRGVETNNAKAVEMYVKATEQGSEHAAISLGCSYEHGLCGVAVNKKEALKWYRVAVELAHVFRGPDAKAHVTRIERELTMTHAD
jgi:TPR repeat protein